MVYSRRRAVEVEGGIAYSKRRVTGRGIGRIRHQRGLAEGVWPRLVDENVGVGRDARHCTGHVVVDHVPEGGGKERTDERVCGVRPDLVPGGGGGARTCLSAPSGGSRPKVNRPGRCARGSPAERPSPGSGERRQAGPGPETPLRRAEPQWQRRRRAWRGGRTSSRSSWTARAAWSSSSSRRPAPRRRSPARRSRCLHERWPPLHTPPGRAGPQARRWSCGSRNADSWRMAGETAQPAQPDRGGARNRTGRGARCRTVVRVVPVLGADGPRAASVWARGYG